MSIGALSTRVRALSIRKDINNMDIFNIIAGTASIISLIISIVSLVKVNDIQRNINESKQNIENTTIDHNSKVVQVGRDYKK